jgi:hypothetical protein
MSIARLMAVEPNARKSAWLFEALQWAIELEFATIPVYLCGMWSILDTNHPVRGYLQSIVLQEMAHLGLACNILTTLGGTPNISGRTPQYPGPLPGGVRPEMVVWLAGFSRAMVRGVYMEIEFPEAGPIAHVAARIARHAYPTIGDLYDAILDAMSKLPESAYKNERQLSVPGLGSANGVFPIPSYTDAKRALTTIKDQGEGTTHSPSPDDDPNDRAHYYRFAEIYHGRQLIQKAGQWVFEGNVVALPAAYPMAEVPEGGFGDRTKDFNSKYSLVVNALQATWERPDGQPCFKKARLGMGILGQAAVELMKQPIADGSGNYGPDFWYLAGQPVPC